MVNTHNNILPACNLPSRLFHKIYKNSRGTILRHLNPQPQLSYFISKANSIKNITFQKKIRVAILSSFTINGLEESLIVKCAERNIRCETYNSPYKQYNQDILSPASPLYEFSPNLTFMIIDTRTILSSLFYNPYSVSTSERREYIDNRVKELANLVRNFTGKSDSKLVVANFSTSGLYSIWHL